MFGPLGRAPLVAIVLNSISTELWYSKDIKDKKSVSVPTMNGKIQLVVKGDDVMAGDAYVDIFDTLGENGVMHGLDTVLESSALDLGEQDYREDDVFFKAIFG